VQKNGAAGIRTHNLVVRRWMSYHGATFCFMIDVSNIRYLHYMLCHVKIT
jgi:hypothetical protein